MHASDMQAIVRRALFAHPLPRCAALALAALLLGGCERTLLAHAPAQPGCDPGLAGRWLSIDEAPGEQRSEGELEVRIGADCSLVTIEQRSAGPRTSAATRLATASAGRRKLLWIDAGWANASFEIDAVALDRPGSIYLFAYALDADRVTLYPLAHRRLAHRILDEDIDGAVLAEDDHLANRIDAEGGALDALLSSGGSYDRDKAWAFRRADASP